MPTFFASHTLKSVRSQIVKLLLEEERQPQKTLEAICNLLG